MNLFMIFRKEEETEVADMATGSAANKPVSSAETIAEQVILDQAGIKITAKALEKKTVWMSA
jgi:hypothetical protein